jgi:hypothetical protein
MFGKPAAEGLNSTHGGHSLLSIAMPADPRRPSFAFFD